jgi:hypothetical protein
LKAGKTERDLQRLVTIRQIWDTVLMDKGDMDTNVANG